MFSPLQKRNDIPSNGKVKKQILLNESVGSLEGSSILFLKFKKSVFLLKVLEGVKGFSVN